MPREASNRISFTLPVSMTVVTSSIVMEVSATLVDTTILTVPAVQGEAGRAVQGGW
jgi:hypothetical protein